MNIEKQLITVQLPSSLYFAETLMCFKEHHQPGTGQVFQP